MTIIVLSSRGDGTLFFGKKKIIVALRQSRGRGDMEGKNDEC